MSNTISPVPFRGTAEQAKKLDEVIASYKGQAGSMIPVLQKAQEIYGYLPIEVQKIVADGLGVSIEKVYEVVSFYAQFTINPKGKHNVSVCLGTACYVKGSGEIFEKLKEVLKIDEGGCTPDGKFSLESCRCVGACGLAPVMLVGDDVYGRLTAKEVPDIIKKYE